MTNLQLLHTIDQNPETNTHLAEIMDSIKSNGWQGLPLVAIGEQLLNGCHRATACALLEIDPQVYAIEAPTASDDEYINDLWYDLGNPTGTDQILVTLQALYDEGLVERYAIDILSAELTHEK